MSLIKYIKSKLFSDKRMPSSHPMVHEMIKRSAEDKEKYENWKNSPERQAFLNFIKSQYELGQEKKEDQSMIRLLASNPSYGFMLRYPENFKSEHFQHLFDFLKERVLELGYITYASDRKMFDRGRYVETIERHYLKPGKDMKLYKEVPLDQLYGNVNIELFKADDNPTHLKLVCNCYSDSAFNKARDFDELISLLCNDKDS